VVTFIVQSLFNELLKTLDVLLINDLGQHAKSVCAHDLVVTLLNVFGQARYNNENLVLFHVQLFNEDVNETTEVLVHVGGHLEQLGDVEEHR